MFLAGTAIAVGMTGPAFAQARDYSISPGRLSDVLAQYAASSGVQLVFNPAALASINSAGLQSRYTVEEGFAHLLAGSGYEVRSAGTGRFVLERIGGGASVAPADGSVNLGTIYLGGQLGSHADTYDSAGSVAYLSDDEISQRRGTSVGDFLSGIPGVMVGDSRNSGAIDVNIRGMQGQSRVPVVVDGASQETTVYRGYAGSAARSYVDPDFISEVSVEKGASMGADATGASGGVVRMRTLNAQDIVQPGRKVGARVKLGFNTNSSDVPEVGTLSGFIRVPSGYDGIPPDSAMFAKDGMDRPGVLEPTGWSGSLALATTSEHFDFLAAFARRKNGNYHAGANGDDGAKGGMVYDAFYDNYRVGNTGLSRFRAGEEVTNTSTDNSSMLLKGTLRFAGDHSLELALNRYDSTYGEIFTSQLTNSYAYQGKLNHVRADSYTARYRWNPDSELIDLKVDLFRTDVDLRNKSIGLSYNSTADTTSWYDQYIFINTVRDGITASNSSVLDLGGRDVKLDYGFTYSKETMGFPDGVDEDEIAWQPRQGWREESSIFLNGEFKPADWLTLNAGLRYSRFGTHDEVENLSGDPNARANTADGGFSPVLSVKADLPNGLQLYAKAGSVLRAPSLFENLTAPQFTYGIQTPVDPERANTFELGLNTMRENVFVEGDSLNLHAAWFNNQIKDYITRATVGVSEAPWGGTSYALTRINLDSAKMRGFELAMDYKTGNVFGGLTWNHYTNTMFCLKPEAEFAYGTERCYAGGVRNSWSLLHVPPKDTVSVNVGVKLMEDRLTLGGRATFTGKRMVDATGDGSALTTYEIKPPQWNPYTLIDLYASYKYDDTTRFDFAIDNVTDLYHMDALTGTNMPAPGRTIRVNLTKNF